MFLADSAGSSASFSSCFSLSMVVRNDVLSAGFILSKKSHFTPVQIAPFLGFVRDLSSGKIEVTQKEQIRCFLSSAVVSSALQSQQDSQHG